MRFLFVILIFASTSTQAIEALWDKNVLAKAWESEEIYFMPKSVKALFTWTGEFYRYSDAKCYSIKERAGTGGSIESVKEIDCSVRLKVAATFPYEKIADFSIFKAKFLECVDSLSRNCMRPLMSRTMRMTSGDAPMVDRRVYLFRSWKKEDFVRLARLIRLGVTGTETEKQFPTKPDPESTTYRGAFRLIDGGWQLIYYYSGN